MWLKINDPPRFGWFPKSNLYHALVSATWNPFSALSHIYIPQDGWLLLLLLLLLLPLLLYTPAASAAATTTRTSVHLPHYACRTFHVDLFELLLVLFSLAVLVNPLSLPLPKLFRPRVHVQNAKVCKLGGFHSYGVTLCVDVHHPSSTPQQNIPLRIFLPS